MKAKRIVTAIAAVAVLAVAGQAGAQDSRLKKILAEGVLKAGTTGDWNPMTIKDPATNSYKGFDIDILTQMAKDLGVKIEFVATDWKTLVSGVIAGKYDITGSASLSPARAKVAGYSKTYFSLATVPITLKKNLPKFRDWADLDKPTVTVAATLGTVQERYIKLYFPAAKKKIIEAPARDYQEVLAGRADANITSNVEAATLVKKFPQLAVVPVKEPRSRTPVAMLLPQADQVWINYVNHWITLQEERGFFAAAAKKWGLAGQ